MLLNRSPGHLLMERNEFDFVVAERPKYIPNSGPPLAPISLMPTHEKDGIIVASFEVNHQIVYVVSWEKTPYLRMTARPETVLDYVSHRTFEEYEYQQTLEREGRGPGQGKLTKGGKGSGARDESQPKKKGKPGRKRKHALVEPEDESGAAESPRPMAAIGPTSRVARPSIEEPEPVFTSPQRPTLMSPSKQRGLAELMESEESEEEEELPTDIAIEAQLGNTMQPHPRSTLSNKVVLSPSPEPSSVSKGKQKAFSPPSRGTRGSSRQVRDSFSRSVSVSTSANEAKRQRRSLRDTSAATSSSLETGKTQGNLRNSKSRSNTPLKKTPKKASHFEQYSSMAKNKKEAISATQPAAPPQAQCEEEEDLGEDEYEVEAILDETQVSVGKKSKKVMTYYLIKWVGNWPLSWEPAENVGAESIEEYESKKHMGLIVVGEAGAAFDAAIAAEEQSKKNKQGKGGRSGDDSGDASKNSRPSQGQVIDDEDGSEYDS
ncbi:hypothetical protein VTL71DRAFT_11973 [Oculimacula yallundae]|uniref:Chromo domain-containing protein n=1 Tax=Oculimacula yallundae TaxID=86028 RepID=A0ABR4CRP0_9HELO